VSILVSISVAVYLPDHASPALIAHEQGHVQICKSVYAESAQAAQACAQELLQRPFTGSSQTQIGATEQATELARKWFCRRFMAATEDRIQKLSLKYDALTDHGRSSVLPAQAVTTVLGGAPAQK
jgi:hypothetical protein